MSFIISIYRLWKFFSSGTCQKISISILLSAFSKFLVVNLSLFSIRLYQPPKNLYSFLYWSSKKSDWFSQRFVSYPKFFPSFLSQSHCMTHQLYIMVICAILNIFFYSFIGIRVLFAHSCCILLLLGYY